MRRPTRPIRLTAVVVAAALAAAPAVAAPTPADRPAGQASPVLNIAHRGASGHAPEHTFAAYDRALAMGADYLEQDLQITADGALVVLHDGTLDRTARGPARNCTGPVDRKTLAQLRTCEVGSWFARRFAGERIRTLDEVLDRYGRKVNYYIELKSPDAADRMEAKLLALLREHGLTRPAQRHRQVLIQSFSAESLGRIHALNPRLPLIQEFPLMPSAAIRSELTDVASYAVGIAVAKDSVDRALIAAAHESCLDVHAATLRTRAEHDRLISLGVDGVFTDFPDRFEAAAGDRAAGRFGAARRAAANQRACAG